VSAFARLSDEKVRYKQLLFLAQKCPPMSASLKVDSNKVPGCLSTVHVHCTYSSTTDTLTYTGDSDGLLTKGLVALLVEGMSGCTPSEVLAVDPVLLAESGIGQSLTPGRNNGFLNMIKVMKEKATSVSTSSPPPSNMDTKGGGPIYNEMITKLQILKPVSLSLTDDSHSHASHPGSAGFNGESHFKLEIVAAAFEGLSGVKRHRLIYTVLGDVMDRIHALEIKAMDTTQV
jgi:sulfur transfer protein SufE/stress-induced morphogen